MHTGSTSSTIDEAAALTDEVQRDLDVASAELGLTNGALDRHLPLRQRNADVAWALAQNEMLERKVQQAADDLTEVCELLEQVRAEARRA